MQGSRPILSLCFTDFPGPYNPERIRQLLKPHFEFDFDKQRPDFVIHSVFGHEFLKYPDAIRIFFTGENVHPDFNLCDYAFGYDWTALEDRYVRAPNYLLYDHFEQLRQERCSEVSIEEFCCRRFCNFVYSNRDAHPFRDEVFHALNAYRKVDSVGKHLRNSDIEIGAAYEGDWWTPKVEFQKSFKFTIAFENSSTPGYTTEKLVHALAAGTVPIYWGNPEVGREFNESRFINCHRLGSAEAVIAKVREVDRDPALQERILSEPFFPGGEPDPTTTPEAVAEALKRIVMQPVEQTHRRNRNFWGRKYEERRYMEAEALDLMESKALFWRATRQLIGWKSRIARNRR